MVKNDLKVADWDVAMRGDDEPLYGGLSYISVTIIILNLHNYNMFGI